MSSSQHRGIKFNDNETTRFLALYATEKVLYDQTLDGYRDRDSREDAAERISRALKIPGLGPKEVITKFKNLRSSYCQELKKIADSVRSGKGAAAAEDGVYRPKVFWFDQMNSFIRPFVQQRPTTTHTNPQIFSKENSVEDSKKCSEEAPAENSQHSEMKFERSAGNSIDTQIDTPGKTVKRKIGPQPSTSKHKITTRDYEMGILKSAIDKLHGNIMSNRASRVAVNCKDDSYEHFGRYIASMLRDIGPPTAIRLQQNITNMITNAMCQPEYLTAADRTMSGKTSLTSGRQSSTFSAGDDEDYDDV